MRPDASPAEPRPACSSRACRLSDNPRAREALRQCLPDALRDATFSNCLKDDVTTKRWLTQLLFNITESSAQGQPQLS